MPTGILGIYHCRTVKIIPSLYKDHFKSSFLGLMINLKVGSLVMNDHNQLKANLSLFLNPTSGIMWMNNQTSQAKKPLKKPLGKSTTALYLAIIAMLPLSLYTK